MTVSKRHSAIHKHYLDICSKTDRTHKGHCNVKEALAQQRKKYRQDKRKHKTGNNNRTCNIIKIEREIARTIGHQLKRGYHQDSKDGEERNNKRNTNAALRFERALFALFKADCLSYKGFSHLSICSLCTLCVHLVNGAFDDFVCVLVNLEQAEEHLARAPKRHAKHGRKSNYHRRQRLDGVGHDGWVNIRLSRCRQQRPPRKGQHCKVERSVEECYAPVSSRAVGVSLGRGYGFNHEKHRPHQLLLRIHR